MARRFTITQPGFPAREVTADDWETAVRRAPTGATVTPTYGELGRYNSTLYIDRYRVVYYYPPAEALYLVTEETRGVADEFGLEEWSEYQVRFLCQLY